MDKKFQQLINSSVYMDENADGAKKVARYLAEAVEGDLIPCAGEWFANVVLIAE